VLGGVHKDKHAKLSAKFEMYVPRENVGKTFERPVIHQDAC
jgi:hypothetical protein